MKPLAKIVDVAAQRTSVRFLSHASDDRWRSELRIAFPCGCRTRRGERFAAIAVDKLYLAFREEQLPYVVTRTCDGSPSVSYVPNVHEPVTYRIAILGEAKERQYFGGRKFRDTFELRIEVAPL